MPESAFNPSYVASRPDVLRLVPLGARVVLDVGCSVGTVGRDIKKSAPGTTVIGIEYSPQMAAEARQWLDRVLVLDLNRVEGELAIDRESVDCIILADVLEHLIDPWSLLRRLRGLLSPSGTVVASIPNIRHLSTLYHVFVRGYWPYRDRGIHDRTHLRFFTLRNIEELFCSAGLTIETLERNLRLYESEIGSGARLTWLMSMPHLRDLFTFQYLIAARPMAGPDMAGGPPQGSGEHIGKVFG